MCWVTFSSGQLKVHCMVKCSAQMQLCGSSVPSPLLDNIKGLKIGEIADRPELDNEKCCPRAVCE